MVNFSYLTLNVNVGDNFWKTVVVSSGLTILIYSAYKFVVKRRRRVNNIYKKTVFITGCDTGFGNALAKQLDDLGSPVIAGCLTETGAKDLDNATSDSVKTVLLDVKSTESIKNAVKFVSENVSEDCELWGVVNNAGITGAGGPVEFQPRSEYQNVMEVNFLGMVDVVNHVLPHLKKSRGRIVNVASMAGQLAIPNYTAYVASKFAVLGYSEALRREKVHWGIKVSTIIPGLFATDIVNMHNAERRKYDQWNALPQEIQEEYGNDYVEKVLENAKLDMQRSVNPDLTLVTNAMEHALFAEYPENVYTVGNDCKLLLFLQKLPFGVIDKMFTSQKFIQMPKILQETSS